ncbi:hypothetical protein [Polaribacter sp. 11A2H]|uniref:hypothetical protein n=1 Tax=Polaribacter sp. 11A2H TaxID=2687290 RepID=UPI00140CD704|nr:hypothetical protein [Polaribacter sp. 11A2H]
MYLKQRGYLKAPLKYIEVKFLGIKFDYVNFLFFFIITLGIAIYLFIYTEDQLIKNKIRKLTFFNRGKNKHNNELLKEKQNDYSNFEEIKLKHKESETIITQKKDKNLSIVLKIIFVALLFTFFMAIETGFSLWFFIILPYYFYISLKPKSKDEILIKSIFYPLFFLIIITVSHTEKVNSMYEMPFLYNLSKHLIFYVTSVLIIFFTQKSRFGKLPKFNSKNPLFWISLISFIISFSHFVVDKYIESIVK